MTNKHDAEIELYNKYKATGSIKDRTQLLKSLQPLLISQHNVMKGTLPDAALKAQITVHAIGAIDSFDPNRGVKLSTHVVNHVKQTHRMNYTYQNTVRMSEDRQSNKFRHYNKALVDLESEFNKDPSVNDIAKRLNWKVKDVEEMQANIFKDNDESKLEFAPEASHFSDDNTKLMYVKSKLDPMELQLFNDKTGGMSQVDLVKKHGLDTNKLNYTQRKLKDKVQMLMEKYDA